MFNMTACGAYPRTPPPGNRRFPPKRVPKPELRHEGVGGNTCYWRSLNSADFVANDISRNPPEDTPAWEAEVEAPASMQMALRETFRNAAAQCIPSQAHDEAGASSRDGVEMSSPHLKSRFVFGSSG